eukprot:CAMPEP_0206184392 /NCGR_PEP_ID=MMETSP0166-20121206/1192_1 /ASSEMBLY_ACC=CAM_ASM_000260 /TAXON_ID=95228 /ORGANISM="Vannella robusta, Strain DIVA3 518/3/11/1/6" /LENGTH=783 /DNA_ID=CAMNT_0053599401 /DNA_START=169 /DNA_END=2517 /DNA_ORIENTATION=+
MQLVVDDLLPEKETNFIVPSKVQLYPQEFAYTGDLDFFNRYWIIDNTDNQISGTLSPMNEQQQLLGNISQYSYLNPNWINITKCPFFEHKESLYDAQQEIRNMFNDFNQYSAHHISHTYMLFQAPDGVVMLDEADIATGNLAYDVMYSDNLVYTRREKMRIPNKIRYEVNSLVHTMNSAFTRMSNGSTVTASIQAFPYWKEPISFDLNDIIGPMLVPFAICFLIPVFMHTIVLEKENRVREMMKMMGLKMSTYWGINYLFDYFVYSSVTALFVVVEICIQARIFTQTSPLLLFVLFFVWGHTQISLSFFMSRFFSKSSLSSVVGYLVVVLSVVTGIALNQFLYPDPGSLPWVFELWPLFVFERAVFILFSTCSDYRCLTSSALWNSDTEMPQIMIQSIVFFLGAVYLDRVIPGAFGIADHPLFCFKTNNASTIDLSDIPTQDEYGWYDDEIEDTDVLMERQRLEKGEIGGTVIIKDMKKLYNSTILPNACHKSSVSQFALKGISFAIQDGQCFGLLGPNGAGKTTLISILTGLYGPSMGTATINGKDIRTEMASIRKEIGICPQFDIQWATLTPLEHVLFYARLKGISVEQENEHAMHLLDQVGLTDSATVKYSSELSGGMRRRLSVAMALAGSPKIVFLDEPTSGLDPISKRQLWDIVSTSKKGRSVILTTHSMEEADVLCDRISIIDQGRLQCIGTHKNKFGFGYRLYVSAKPGEEESVQMVSNFVEKVIPSAKLVEQFQNNMVYQIPLEFQHPSKLTKIFSTIETNKTEQCIEEWSISPT